MLLRCPAVTPVGPDSSPSDNEQIFRTKAQVKQKKVYLSLPLRLWQSPGQCTPLGCKLVLVHIAVQK